MYMPPPVPRCSGWAYSSLVSPNHVSLPRFGGRVGLHIDLFGACSAFTRVAACTLARSPIATAIRRLQPFRYLHDCSDCFRLERIAGWASYPLESAAFSRRTPTPAVRETGDRCPLIPSTAVRALNTNPRTPAAAAQCTAADTDGPGRARALNCLSTGLGGRLLREESNAISGRGRSRSAACIAGTGDHAARRNSH